MSPGAICGSITADCSVSRPADSLAGFAAARAALRCGKDSWKRLMASLASTSRALRLSMALLSPCSPAFVSPASVSAGAGRLRRSWGVCSTHRRTSSRQRSSPTSTLDLKSSANQYPVEGFANLSRASCGLRPSVFLLSAKAHPLLVFGAHVLGHVHADDVQGHPLVQRVRRARRDGHEVRRLPDELLLEHRPLGLACLRLLAHVGFRADLGELGPNIQVQNPVKAQGRSALRERHLGRIPGRSGGVRRQAGPGPCPPSPLLGLPQYVRLGL